jgi:hypothetical protein
MSFYSLNSFNISMNINNSIWREKEITPKVMIESPYTFLFVSSFWISVYAYHRRLKILLGNLD